MTAQTPKDAAALRAEVLEKLWWKAAEGALAAVSVECPSAGALQAARAFLGDNGVSRETLASLRGGRNPLGALANSLPTFADEPDGLTDGRHTESDDALSNVPPFAPARPEDTAD